MSQYSAAVGRSALASQSAALYSAKLATVEPRDQMAANMLAPASSELDHCNKHVNAQDRLAVIASPALSGHSSNAHEPTQHHSEELLDKLLATMKTTPFISAMLNGMAAWHQHRQPRSWTACSKEPALMAQYLLCAGGFWLSHGSVTSLSLTVNTGLSAGTAVLLAQSAFMHAQMLESLSNPCSSKHMGTARLPLWHWLPARIRLSQGNRHQDVSPEMIKQAHQHILYLDCW